MSMYVIDPPSEPDELGLGQTLDTIQKIVEGERELCPHVELTQDGARCMHCLEEVE